MLPKKNLSSVNTDKQVAPPSTYCLAILIGLKFFIKIPFEGLAFFISAIIEIFNGKHNAFLEIVALNAAAGLVISEKENNLKKAYYKTKSYLLSGNAIKKINQLAK